MTATLSARFRTIGGTAAEWAANDIVPLLRELALETDTRKFKFGDGVTAYSALPYASGVSWGDITGTLSAQTDLQSALNAKEPTITAGTTGQYWRGDKSWQTLNAAAVGITPAALTKTDDTNVTLTLGGSPTTALLAAASLTLGWTGQLAVSRGGTGTSTSTGTGSVVLASSPSITTPTITTSMTLSSASTANLNFSANGGTVTGLFQLDTGGNMVFRQNTSGGMFFDYFSTLNFRNNSFTNVLAISNSGVVSILGDVTPKTNNGASLGTSSLRWLASYVSAYHHGIRTITATATVAATDSTILCDASSGSLTVNLPAASGQNGRTLTIKKIEPSSTANTVTIDGSGSETIDGATTQVISTQWSSLTIHCNGTAWFII